jgi:hypothetical protein
MVNGPFSFSFAGYLEVVNVVDTFTNLIFHPIRFRIREVSVSRRAQDDRDGTSRGLRPVDHVNIDLLLEMAAIPAYTRIPRIAHSRSRRHSHAV